MFALRRYIAAAASFTLALNILMLVSPLHMIQVYDRVLTSGSVDSLLLITLLATALLGVYAIADAGRKRVFTLLGTRFFRRVEQGLFARAMRSADPGREVPAAVGDLATVQKFIAGGGAAPFFDAPYAPLFAALLFFVHPVMGAVGLTGAFVLIGLAVASEVTTRTGTAEIGRKESSAQVFLAGLSRQANAVLSMGMVGRAFQRWQTLVQEGHDGQLVVGERSAVLAAASRGLRQILQVLMLSVGAYYTLRHEVSPGAIIASSIILSRALGPVDHIVGAWPQIVRVREAWAGLTRRLPEGALDRTESLPLPRPEARLTLEGVAIATPGTSEALVGRMSLTLEPGSLMVVVGPSGSGKTSLLQTLSGAWAPMTGTVRLGGSHLHAWDADDRGAHVGYMPQDVELLPGKVWENITRFQPAEPPQIHDAAEKAHCADAIVRLPQGYDTLVGPGGAHISAGQKQGIGLARALFGTPALILLDEPTAHLDLARATGVRKLLESLKTEAHVVVVASHDLRLLEIADYVMSLNAGQATVSTGKDFMKEVVNLRRTRPTPVYATETES
ncbi:hypothetical protein ABAC402_02610 [Asticcacaulis sp. AC402]|nr:hypothetical protein ABAC402_02610 [Asticcacaulis sp. AC402]